MRWVLVEERCLEWFVAALVAIILELWTPGVYNRCDIGRSSVQLRIGVWAMFGEQWIAGREGWFLGVLEGEDGAARFGLASYILIINKQKTLS